MSLQFDSLISGAARLFQTAPASDAAASCFAHQVRCAGIEPQLHSDKRGFSAGIYTDTGPRCACPNLHRRQHWR